MGRTAGRLRRAGTHLRRLGHRWGNLKTGHATDVPHNWIEEEAAVQRTIQVPPGRARMQGSIIRTLLILWEFVYRPVAAVHPTEPMKRRRSRPSGVYRCAFVITQ
eukprot:gene1291-biopygen3987